MEKYRLTKTLTIDIEFEGPIMGYNLSKVLNEKYEKKLIALVNSELKNFKTGVEHGEQKSWDQNGELMYKYIYDNGRKYGIQGSVICNGGNELEVLN